MKMTLKFTPEHQWIRLTDQASLLATVGITEHAQETLGDIVFVSTPNIGDVLTQNTVVSEVESVKAASDVFAPVSGEVIEINPLIKDDPGLINKDPMGEGWFFKMRVDSNADLEKLLSLDQYHKSIGK